MKVSRYLTLRCATGQLRTAKFRDREHIVVPVVALVEGVVFAVNAKQPELVLREELAKAPLGWNGRPVCAGHPRINGEPVSANDPRVLERDSFGFLAYTEFKTDRLTTSAFLDPQLIRPDSQAERVLRRLEKGESVEVSVGTFMEIENKSGIWAPTGEKYGGIWRNLVPDHLAMLEEGEVGACSLADGCGALRTATIYIVTDRGLKSEPPATELRAAEANMSVLDKIFGGFRGKGFRAADTSMSDDELRMSLENALRDTEPGFLGVGPIYPEEAEAIYAVQLTDQPVQLFRRGYTVKEDKTVTLKDKRTEVRQETQYVPVDASAAPGSAQRTACGCKNKPITASGENDMDKAARVNSLISSGRFKETDRNWLTQSPDEALVALETPSPSPTPAPAAPSTPSTQPTAPSPAPATPSAPPATPSAPPASSETAQPVAATANLSLEQFIALAPAHLQPELRAAAEVTKTAKTAAIATLKASGRNQFSDEELAGMELPQLQKLAALVAAPTASAPRVVDFAARGVPRAASTAGQGEDTAVPEPPDLSASIRAARGQQ